MTNFAIVIYNSIQGQTFDNIQLSCGVIYVQPISHNPVIIPIVTSLSSI